ncbi:hypothetical protein [Enterococcus sp. 5H]|uniref:hypothetical protein n=1 Tax=Enterococcus sp. 5H TaxID=1229490 RepID=UPI0023032061|nr:hypothetical protein [Enterococcus sp. 5H]MDA9472090.1 hypothetical protein [Enterococcus sp. 5H]
MEITIKGNPEEITKLLQTIASSQEQRETVTSIHLDGEELARAIHEPLSLDKNQSVTCHF